MADQHVYRGVWVVVDPKDPDNARIEIDVPDLSLPDTEALAHELLRVVRQQRLLDGRRWRDEQAVAKPWPVNGGRHAAC